MTESFATFSFARGPARKPAIICGKLNFGDLQQVRQLISALAQCLSDPLAWHRLEVDKGCYFRAPDRRLSTRPGWYVICDEQRTPLYVGKANDLNGRLNSENGSRDGFLNSQRQSDPERNFIKVLTTMDYITGLRVGVVDESDLLPRIALMGPLGEVDRGNVEKTLNLFRHAVVTGRTDCPESV